MDLHLSFDNIQAIIIATVGHWFAKRYFCEGDFQQLKSYQKSDGIQVHTHLFLLFNKLKVNRTCQDNDLECNDQEQHNFVVEYTSLHRPQKNTGLGEAIICVVQAALTS